MHSGPKNKNEKLESVENWLKFKIGQIGQKWKIGFFFKREYTLALLRLLSVSFLIKLPKMSWFPIQQKISHSTKISLVAKISPFKFPFCQKSPFFQKISLVSKISLWQKFPNFSKNLPYVKNLPFIIFFINIPYWSIVENILL